MILVRYEVVKNGGRYGWGRDARFFEWPSSPWIAWCSCGWTRTELTPKAAEAKFEKHTCEPLLPRMGRWLRTVVVDSGKSFADSDFRSRHPTGPTNDIVSVEVIPTTVWEWAKKSSEWRDYRKRKGYIYNLAFDGQLYEIDANPSLSVEFDPKGLVTQVNITSSMAAEMAADAVLESIKRYRSGPFGSIA